MRYTLGVLLEYGKIILSAISEVSRVVQKREFVRGGHIHHSVDFLGSLHYRAHMVMIYEPYAHRIGYIAQSVHSLGKLIPFRVVHHVFCVEYGGIHLSLYAKALLGRAYSFCAHCFQKFTLRDKVLFDFSHRLGEHERRKPLICYLKTSHIESFFEHCGILGILVAYFATLEACKCHFAHALFKGVFTAQIGHIVVGPRYRRDTQFDFVLVHNFPPFILISSRFRKHILFCLQRIFLRVVSGVLRNAYVPPAVIAVRHRLRQYLNVD